MKKSAGFTLIEVLIALAIVAIALMAIVKATSYDVKDTIYIQQKSIANWVAMNLIARAQLKLIPTSGQGEIKMLNQTLYWQIQAERTDMSRVNRLNIVVSNKQNGTPLIRRWGFMLSG